MASYSLCMDVAPAGSKAGSCSLPKNHAGTIHVAYSEHKAEKGVMGFPWQERPSPGTIKVPLTEGSAS